MRHRDVLHTHVSPTYKRSELYWYMNIIQLTHSYYLPLKNKYYLMLSIFSPHRMRATLPCVTSKAVNCLEAFSISYSTLINSWLLRLEIHFSFVRYVKGLNAFLAISWWISGNNSVLWHEQERENPTLTEWDRFAHREYIRLSMEEDVEDISNGSGDVWDESLEAPFWFQFGKLVILLLTRPPNNIRTCSWLMENIIIFQN